jgi:hypothetical protein
MRLGPRGRRGHNEDIMETVEVREGGNAIGDLKAVE